MIDSLNAEGAKGPLIFMMPSDRAFDRYGPVSAEAVTSIRKRKREGRKGINSKSKIANRKFEA
jgi:hypothetical protein